MNKSPLIIGITGTIGSGKSAVGEILARYGAEIIDADQLAREVVLPNTPALQEIVRQFGTEVVDTKTKTLDRKKLGEIVFGNPAQKKALESIVHPRIRQLFLDRLEKAKHSQSPPWLIAYLVPLLFESGYAYNELDLTVTVSAPEEQCLARVVARDGCKPEVAKQRLSTQLPAAEKELLADLVVKNTGTIQDLESQVEGLVSKLRSHIAATT
jgi:dephospho-CoA kinase